MAADHTAFRARKESSVTFHDSFVTSRPICRNSFTVVKTLLKCAAQTAMNNDVFAFHKVVLYGCWKILRVSAGNLALLVSEN